MPHDGRGSPTQPRGLRGVLLAIFFVAAAFALTIALRQLSARAYFILFVPAVMFSSWFGGRASGLIASALSVLATFFLVPRAEVGIEFAWLVVAALVTVGTSVLTDLRRRAEAQLTARAEEESSRRRDAESLSQLKTDVLVQVAHELRQPLSAIMTAGRLLGAPAPESARTRALGVIGRQTEHLRLLIDDLFDLSKMTRQELQLRMSNFDLCEVVDDSVNLIAPDVAARRIELSSSRSTCPLHMTADPTRVRQILSNLLSNAVKFTPEGGTIALTVEQTGSHVVMRVRDNGQGIAPERLPRVLISFTRAIRKVRGSGLGWRSSRGLPKCMAVSSRREATALGRGANLSCSFPMLNDEC